MTLLDLHLHSYLQYGMLLLDFMPVLTPEFKYSTVSFDNGIGSFSVDARFQQNYTCGILFLGMPWER